MIYMLLPGIMRLHRVLLGQVRLTKAIRAVTREAASDGRGNGNLAAGAGLVQSMGLLRNCCFYSHRYF